MNEGHAGFAALERVSDLMRSERLSFEDAALAVRSSTAFTTHTPVPAGHDRFHESLIRRYLADTEGWIGLGWGEFMALGQDPGGGDQFNMTYLACNLAGYVNGVSRKHGEVSRGLLSSFWPSLLEHEVPVGHVTNGVHLPTWTRPGLQELLGASETGVVGSDFTRSASSLPAEPLWRERQAAKAELLEHCRGLLTRCFQQRQESPKVLARMLEGLREDALVIGFARRFAPYKRATLLFQDPDRLARILSQEDRPVCFLFSGKAHPADGGGQDLLKHIANIARDERFIGKVIFLEDYDIGLARKLKQGVDVWLNNPVRPLEASGTSGMKVAANGGLNLSILDGWWIEGCDGRNGWAVGNEDKTYPNQELQNQLDNESLLALLEDEVIPLYFDRGPDGIPHAWLERVRHALATLPECFDTNRMVGQYSGEAYAPLARAHRSLVANDHQSLEHEAAHRMALLSAYDSIRVRAVRAPDLGAVRSGDTLSVEADVELAGLDPSAVEVEFIYGHAGEHERALYGGILQPMAPTGAGPEGASTFRTTVTVQASGSYRFGVRVRPSRRGPWDADLTGRTLWA